MEKVMTDREALELLTVYWCSMMDGDTHHIGDAEQLLRDMKLVDEYGYPLGEDTE